MLLDLNEAFENIAIVLFLTRKMLACLIMERRVFALRCVAMRFCIVRRFYSYSEIGIIIVIATAAYSYACM